MCAMSTSEAREYGKQWADTCTLLIRLVLQEWPSLEDDKLNLTLDMAEACIRCMQAEAEPITKEMANRLVLYPDTVEIFDMYDKACNHDQGQWMPILKVLNEYMH